MSLSGRPKPEWRAFLASHNIHQMHDRTSPDPVTNLGYPICSSIAQHNIAFQAVYNTIQQCIHIHSQRNLSIRGRATVLSTLIFSKLWHILRNFIFIKTKLLSLRSLGSSFINFRIFPKLSFRTMQQPRHQGGLQVLDPIVQQQALQWRWIRPLILAACHSPLLPQYTTTNIPLLQYTLQWYYSSNSFSEHFYYCTCSFPLLDSRFGSPIDPAPIKLFSTPSITSSPLWIAFLDPSPPATWTSLQVYPYHSLTSSYILSLLVILISPLPQLQINCLTTIPVPRNCSQ